jgi:hypothetical protein
MTTEQIRKAILLLERLKFEKAYKILKPEFSDEEREAVEHFKSIHKNRPNFFNMEVSTDQTVRRQVATHIMLKKAYYIKEKYNL